MTLRAVAPAKINLSLEVHSVQSDGYHPIRSLTQSIDWSDFLELDSGPNDLLSVTGLEIDDSPSNLVWKAVEALAPDRTIGFQFKLEKRIPIAAGLGGGSADAAAALVLANAILRLDPSPIVLSVGADVPFCLQGGLAWMEGYGERLTSLEFQADYAVCVVVPPFPLSTAEVFRAWDRLGGPEGWALSESALPTSLRGAGPLVNDLYPAAVDLAPELDDWRAELQNEWSRPVLMSGSGPSLFSFFEDDTEAASALRRVPSEARASRVATPIGYGARLI